jgi:hypothetical protein
MWRHVALHVAGRIPTSAPDQRQICLQDVILAREDRPMTLEDFAEMTRRVMESDGFADYLPTACFPSRRVVTALQGYPEHMVPPHIVHEWASERAEGEPYMVAFKVDANHFQVDSVDGANKTSTVFEAPPNRL